MSLVVGGLSAGQFETRMAFTGHDNSILPLFRAQCDVRRVSVPLSLLLPEGSTLEEVSFGLPQGRAGW